MSKFAPEGTQKKFGLQTAKQAAAVATAYEKATLQLTKDMRSSPQLGWVINQIEPGIRDADRFTPIDKTALIAANGPNGRTVVDSLQSMLFESETVQIWREHRVIYRVHPELAVSLAETEPGTQIPCEVFRRLPHPDPFITFPTPLPAPHPTGAKQVTAPPVYVGILVVGWTNEITLCSTADPRLWMLKVTLIGRVQSVGNSEPDYPWYSIQIPCSPQHRYTVEEMIREVHHPLDGISPNAAPTDIELNAYRLAVSLLLYLCSNRCDLGSATELLPGRKKRRTQGVMSTVIDLGFDVGPKLLAAQEAATNSEAGLGSGRRIRSHIRRAHWHTYWTGPHDEQVADVRWLHPILVNPVDRDPSRPTVIDADEPEDRRPQAERPDSQ
ncbi:hypothetical protein [Nocardia transvalensis]|uniref:hypothetical protein n=1 Tax=Nocardia transvalensis TaxID=37333 RepID=UPI001895B27E|nr:hypothetical protein [Nocardia transvalensis]MBF6329792.1 hypothetical protein [Nocardia transvalensis]